MNEKNLKTTHLKINGMTCGSCEIILERKLKKVPGVIKANVNHRTGIANIVSSDQHPSFESLEAAINSAGYTMGQVVVGESSRQKWLEIGASLLIIFALYEILKALDITSFVSSTAAGTTTLGGILLIGLVAGMSSCLAVTGGLLLSVAAKYNETHQSLNEWEKFRPLLQFNAGRLFSYFLFGGLVGILGRSVTLSTRMNGYIGIFIALVMLYLALSILKIIPKGKFGIHPPKRLSHWIANLSESQHPAAPICLGMLTFFLPCGFTQSLQLVALASGSFIGGAMTMFIFALGTLPALLGISVISSTTQGKTSRRFLRFSGALVLVLAIFNLNSGLLLTGVDASNLLPSFTSNASTSNEKDPNVTIDPDGTQVINMRITSYGYSPSSFTVVSGKPTIIRATADSNSGGCASALTIPSFNLGQYVAPGTTAKIGPFTPTNNFLLTCSMGMFRANVTVTNI